jgi:hypothetical protein
VGPWDLSEHRSQTLFLPVRGVGLSAVSLRFFTVRTPIPCKFHNLPSCWQARHPSADSGLISHARSAPAKVDDGVRCPAAKIIGTMS